MSLKRDIEAAINRNSAENGSDTPDYILGAFLTNCLAAFELATRDRDEWYGFQPWALLGVADHAKPEASDTEQETSDA